MSKAYYPDVQPNPDFPQIEEAVLAFWKKNHIFQHSVENRRGAPEFIFYDGPPFANGLPHYGHLLTGYVKDVFARYQTMRGRCVERRFGWDCHGLPAEMGSEKELGISGRAAITHYGIGRFNEHCRTSVMKYTREWEEYVDRQARWVDFKHDYKTMDLGFMESVLWAFKQLYDKGLIFEAYRVMPYSWAAETPLSNFETKLDNSYREREDKAVTVAFELNTPPHGAPKADKYYVLAWTTTPWTLPSNLALAVGKEVKYSYAVINGNCFIMAQNARQGLLPLLLSKGKLPHTARLNVRAFVPNDEQSLSELLSDKEVMTFIGGNVRDKERSASELQMHIEAQGKNGYSLWALNDTESGEFVGRAGLMFRALDPEQDEQVELAYLLHKKYWGKGLCTELCEAILEWGFFNLAPKKIVAAADKRNIASIKVLEKLGFIKTKDITFRGIDCDYFELTGEAFAVRRQIPHTALLGLSYHPLFPYFASHKHSFRILDGSNFVTDADGTGIVHMAPGFGEDDQKVCEANGIEIVVPVDGQGRFTDEIYDLPDLKLKGLNVIAENVAQYKFGEANDRIIKWLKDHGHLIKQEQIKHNYPHCWRTDQPLIYRALPSWYVEVTKFRDRAVEINKTINWIPEHIRDGQMGHMLATAPDWSISRNRFWGTPIPVWQSKSGKIKVFGSIAEIEEAWNASSCGTPKASAQDPAQSLRASQDDRKKVTDLHRPAIDDIVIVEDGEEFRRVEDVFDCWFESGSMPFAQVHYPFENKEWFEAHFPADFITEYVGQTRGWFNTLIMLSTALFDCAPFKNCICHGVVLDSETGLKYSKRLKNYKDPMEVFDKFGADALRWMMLSSPVMRGMDISVDPEGKFIRDVVRLAIKPIWNAYNFFCLYANADGVTASSCGPRSGSTGSHAAIDPAQSLRDSQDDEMNVMDRYILAKCKQAVEQIEKSFDAYDTPGACDAVAQFFEALNNWYIRRNKERFWKHEHDADKQAAYDTLYTVLTVMCRAAAPLLPLTLDDIYKGLTGEESVHLAEFPSLRAEGEAIQSGSPRGQEAARDDELMRQMDAVRDICNAALAIRNRLNIRVRQPLRNIKIIEKNWPLEELSYYEGIIKDELNVKSLDGSSDVEAFATPKLTINNPILGKRLPALMKQIIPASKKGEWEVVDGVIKICGEKLLPGEYTLQLEPKPEYKDRAQALSTNDALVILDTTVTPELEAEGIARDMVRMIQQARKDAALNVSDRIRLHIAAPEAIARAVRAHKDYVMEQTLSVELSDKKPEKPTFQAENTLDDQKVLIAFSVAA